MKKHIIFLYFLSISLSHNSIAQTQYHEASLQLEKACDWYNLSIGSWISFACLMPEPSSKSICVTGQVVKAVCTINGAIQIVIKAEDDVITGLSGIVFKEVADHTGGQVVKTVITSADKFNALWNIANEESKVIE